MKTAADIYRFTVDPDSDTAAANVLRFVGCGREVLEIGAGPGSIARPLKEFNGCRVSAVEIDPKSVEILREFCHEVWQRDLNDPTWIKGIPRASYDAVVIADVLEHISDPWTTLQLAASLISETGSIIVSIPHASHASIIACLMNNDFEYHDWGLLDRTHIRFFSMKNIQALFEDAGLAIVDFSYVLKHPSETEFAQAWDSLPARTKAVVEQGEYANVYQVVIRAVPADGARLQHVHGQRLLDRPAPSLSKLRYVAFYLPQFHPIPENDAWWGKGFTEWTNVTKAKPLFPGHYQPHLPSDLGFYDLRLREAQHQQISLARSHGIDAFCFHYYWFAGRRLLERPVLDFLDDPSADIDFCLCWANENWTRKWDASEHEILMPQTYSTENDIAFIESVFPFFRDTRYVRVNGTPMLVVYRPQQLPNARATADTWRRRCREEGIGEIHLVAALTHGNREFEQFGYDAGVEFPPHNAGPTSETHLPDRRDALGLLSPKEGTIWDFAELAESYLGRDYGSRPIYRTVVPSWDNTARIGERAVMLHQASPENYERWLEAASHRTVAERAPGERLVFINAWNEWAEGCHLEPDRRHGRAFLEATDRVKNGHSSVPLEWSSEAGWLEPGMPTTVDHPAVVPDIPLAVVAASKLRRYPGLYRTFRLFYRVILKPRTRLVDGG